MKPWRMAILTPTCPPAGGGVAAAQYQLYRLFSSEHEVRVFAFDDPRASEPDVIRRRTPGSLRKWMETAGRLYVRRYSKDRPARFVPSITRICFGVRRLSKPLRSFAPHFVIVPDNGVPLYWLHPPPAAKVIWVSHHNYRRFRDNPLIGRFSWADVDVAHSMENKALRKVDAAVCPCEYMVKEFRQAYNIDVPIYKIPNCVDLKQMAQVEAADLRSDCGWPDDARVAYIPAAGSDIKGRRYVFEIVRRLHAATAGQLRFFLSGDLSRDLEFEFRQAGLQDFIHAPGRLPWSDNLRNIKACDLGIYPTLADNFSMAILEGMALGVPFATFDTGGNKEIIVHGKSGWIVPYLDVDGLVECSLNVLMSSNGDLTKANEAASLRINEIVNSGGSAKRYFEMFSDMLG